MNIVLRFAAFMAQLLPQSVKQAIYRIKPLAGFLRGSLNAAAPHGLTQVQVAAGELAGMNLMLDLHTEKDYWLGTYEPELQQAAHDLIKTGMVIYDIGANIGYISLMCAKLSGDKGVVYAFEALPANIERLKNNIALNDFSRRIQVNQFAVVEASRQVEFLIHSSGAMGKAVGSAGRSEQYDHTIKVKGISLDDFIFRFGNPKPELIKMDIEGGEILAVKGMQRTLKDIHPLFLIELHGQEAAEATWNALKSSGYKIQQMAVGYPQIDSLAQLGWKSYIIAK